MTRILIAAALLAAGIVVASAQSATIAQREQIMKTVGAGVYGDVGKMTKGQQPFDLTKAQAAYATVISASQKMPDLFPDDSQTGKTYALPAIWTNKDDFNARWTKLGQDAATLSPTITDVASLKTATTQLLQNCNNCHQKYRAKIDD